MSGRRPPAHMLARPDDVEAQFYEALREGDLDALMALWHEDEDIVCVHPGGGQALRGHAAIRRAFEGIFANSRLRIELVQVRRLQTPQAVVHSVVERIQEQVEGRLVQVHMQATNVYLRVAEGWRLAAHHASAFQPRGDAPGDELPGSEPQVPPSPGLLH